MFMLGQPTVEVVQQRAPIVQPVACDRRAESQVDGAKIIAARIAACGAYNMRKARTINMKKAST